MGASTVLDVNGEEKRRPAEKRNGAQFNQACVEIYTDRSGKEEVETQLSSSFASREYFVCPVQHLFNPMRQHPEGKYTGTTGQGQPCSASIIKYKRCTGRHFQIDLLGMWAVRETEIRISTVHSAGRAFLKSARQHGRAFRRQLTFGLETRAPSS